MKTLNRALIQQMQKLEQEFFEIQIPEDFWKRKFFISTQPKFNLEESETINFIDYSQYNLDIPYLSDPFSRLNYIDFSTQKFMIAKEMAATNAQFLEKYLELNNNQTLLFQGTSRQSFLTKNEFKEFFNQVDSDFFNDIWTQMKYSPVLFIVTKNEDNTFSVTNKVDLDEYTITDYPNPLKF